MAEFCFDSVRVPQSALVQQAGGASAETMAGRFILGVAETPQGGIDRVFSLMGRSADRREGKASRRLPE
ncbi:hypothetical protein B5P45_19865 [Phyllobacterium zundukense]|uniref:Uncharacterized protein n=1 Tax=Phyllobacterium zundukense TaxID=1867719 RepID=A0A2N9VTA6_9HYPH|nr:hypothetical protein B5P45_19865 [Phyllobacterium zundukense]